VNQTATPAVGTTAPSHSFKVINNGALNTRTDPATGQSKGYEWLVHLDRQLTSNIELLHVSTVSPALLTQTFMTGNAGFVATPNSEMFLYHGHTKAPGTPTATLPYFIDLTNAPSHYKLLDLLVTGSHMPGSPLGWRTTGKMNINGFTTLAPFLAVTDPQLGNTFGVANSEASWAALNTSRTPIYNGTTPVVRSTIDETGTATMDNPIKALSASANYYDTLLRSITPGNVAQMMSVAPTTFNVAHPYMQYEQLRKVSNNLSTTSDSFLMLATVSFFEVENGGPYGVTNAPVLGREVFNVTPGDLRIQYSCITDRSNLVVPLNATTIPKQIDFAAVLADEKPWAVSLTADATAGASSISVEAMPPGLSFNGTTVGVNQLGIIVEGEVKLVNVGNSLRVGHGDALLSSNNGDGEAVLITGITQRIILLDASNIPQNVQFQVTLTLGVPLSRNHSTGTQVSNCVLGNAGPQSTANKPTLAQLKQRDVVPDFGRMYP